MFNQTGFKGNLPVPLEVEVAILALPVEEGEVEGDSKLVRMGCTSDTQQTDFAGLETAVGIDAVGATAVGLGWVIVDEMAEIVHKQASKLKLV